MASCGRGALCGRPQSDPFADRRRSHSRAVQRFAGDRAGWERPRGEGLRALRRLALRRGVGRRIHGVASQALPHARRRLRYAARGNTRHSAAPYDRLQRGRGVCVALASFSSARRDARRGAVRLRRIPPRAHETQGFRIERGGPRSGDGDGDQESVLESAPIRRREHTRAFTRRMGRTTSAAISRVRCARAWRRVFKSVFDW